MRGFELFMFGNEENPAVFVKHLKLMEFSIERTLE